MSRIAPSQFTPEASLNLRAGEGKPEDGTRYAVLRLRPTVAHKRSIGCFPSGAAHLRSRASVTAPGDRMARRAVSLR